MDNIQYESDYDGLRAFRGMLLAFFVGLLIFAGAVFAWNTSLLVWGIGDIKPYTETLMIISGIILLFSIFGVAWSIMSIMEVEKYKDIYHKQRQ